MMIIRIGSSGSTLMMDGVTNHKKNYYRNRIWDFSLDNNVVWFKECHMYFHKDNDRNVSRMDATILEGVCGCIECAKNLLVLTHETHVHGVNKTKGSKSQAKSQQVCFYS
jgi:hypothetical protein